MGQFKEKALDALCGCLWGFACVIMGCFCAAGWVVEKISGLWSRKA